jgi:hypothetical protein
LIPVLFVNSINNLLDEIRAKTCCRNNKMKDKEADGYLLKDDINKRYDRTRGGFLVAIHVISWRGSV